MGYPSVKKVTETETRPSCAHLTKNVLGLVTSSNMLTTAAVEEILGSWRYNRKNVVIVAFCFLNGELPVGIPPKVSIVEQNEWRGIVEHGVPVHGYRNLIHSIVNLRGFRVFSIVALDAVV